MKFTRFQIVLGFCSLGMGCAATLPTEQLTTAKASVAAAEVAGGNDEPQAALELKRARDQIEQAEKLIADDEFEAAEWLLRRAAVDADLALALAEEAATAKSALEAKEDLEKLKKELSH